MIQVKFTRTGPWFESNIEQATAAFAANYTNVPDCFADMEQGMIVVTNYGTFRSTQSDVPAKTPPILFTADTNTPPPA